METLLHVLNFKQRFYLSNFLLISKEKEVANNLIAHLKFSQGTFRFKYVRFMQTKKLRLKKNNWSSEMYKFDEVFTEGSSQRRVYEAVAKPVVEASQTSGCFILIFRSSFPICVSKLKLNSS